MTRALGGVLALLGVIVAIFSCLDWASGSDERAVIAISGLGGVTVDTEGYSDDILGQIAEKLEESTVAGGIPTLIIGIALVILGIVVAANVFPRIVAVVAAVLALASFIYAVVVVGNPGRMLIDLPDADAGGGASDAAYGLWLVVVASLLAVAVSVAAAVSTKKTRVTE